MTIDDKIAGAPMVSVVITVFNREDFIAESIESVLGQTWKNLEVVVVDDCSTDQSYTIAERYLSDPRVRVFRNDTNLGQFPNRNRAAALAVGEFLKFHDSDDVMYPHCIEFMAPPLIAEPRAALALTSSRSWEGGRVPMLLSPELAFEREFLGIGLLNGGPANALFRKSPFIEQGGFDDIGAGSDHLFWMRYLAVHSVLLVNADLFFYRRHQGQEMVSDEAAASYARLYGLVWRFLAEGRAPLHRVTLDRAKSNWLWIIAKATIQDVKAGRIGLARLRLASAGLGFGDWIKYFRRPSRSIAAGTPQTEMRGSS
ncbi:MAG: glycosyltransferase family 2 protein [Gemmatimonadales bacterium]